jgi:VWFA-related protein
VDSWTAPPAPEASFGEEIDVALATVVVRAVDGRGRPILGLRPEDFRAVAAGKEVAVLGADWHGTADPGSSLPGGIGPAVAGEDPPGKLVVVFVQADLHPSRISGQMRLRPHSRELLDGLEPADRVAVVSFDSHLHLWMDFTRDREAVHRAIDEAMLLNGGRGGGVARRSRDSSRLAAHFDFDAARAVATPERALQVTAEALRPLPGEKALVYLGWGLGRYTAGFGVTMTPDYQPAIQALLDARATVFVLDVTSADFHDLEVGLESVAEATGGTYSKTHVFPGQATSRLAGTLSGYYVLALDPGALPAGARRVRITLRDGRGEILARPLTPSRPGG